MRSQSARVGSVLIAEEPGVFDLLDGFLAEIGEPTLDAAARDRIGRAAAAGRIRFFVAKRNEIPVGLCTLAFAWSTFGGGAPMGVLDDVYVLPAARGQGVARALVERVLEEAQEAGCCSVIVGCSEADVALYRHLGFTTRLGTMLSRVFRSTAEKSGPE